MTSGYLESCQRDIRLTVNQISKVAEIQSNEWSKRKPMGNQLSEKSFLGADQCIVETN